MATSVSISGTTAPIEVQRARLLKVTAVMVPLAVDHILKTRPALAMLKPMIVQAAGQLTGDISAMGDQDLIQLLTFMRGMLTAVARPDSTEDTFADELADLIAPYIADE